MFKQYRDMTTDERAQAADELTALFVGLPGVVGAPMISGESFWRDVAEHLLEMGVRIVADPIKHYEVGRSIDRAEAAGKYIYDEDIEPPVSAADKYAAVAESEQAELAAKVAQMRADGLLPPANATPAERARFRQKRAARAEASAFQREQGDRRRDGTLQGSPLEGVGKPKRRKR